MVFESDHFTLILAICLSGEFSNVSTIFTGFVEWHFPIQGSSRGNAGPRVV